MRMVSATELAKMGKCERQIYLDAKYGESTELTASYIEKGNRDHEKFQRTITGQDKRCFVATAIFGQDAPETVFLRQFRDEWLLTNLPGRMFTSLYYNISPSIVELLQQWPTLLKSTRWILCWLIRIGGK
jgi:hypothetical protein